MFQRSKFYEAYSKFTNEWHLFTIGIVDFQEDIIMVLVTCKDMERWYDKAHQAVERIDYISAVQQGRDVEEHSIWVLRDSIIDCIKKSSQYWVKMAQEPH
jgi:hypothetical protein